jgi:hypothetical protein
MSEEEPPAVDTSLIDEMMKMTVRERLELNDRVIRMVAQLREAFETSADSRSADPVDADFESAIVRSRRSASD